MASSVSGGALPARAVVVADTGESLDHATASDRVARLSTVLTQPGLGEGDVVALLSDSSLAALEFSWAARRAGLVLLAVDPSLSLEETAYVINDSGAKLFAASAWFSDAAVSLAPLTPYVMTRLAFDGTIENHRSLTLARSTAAPYEGAAPPAGTLHYSAAATGRPAPCEVVDPVGSAHGRAELAAILGVGRAAALGPDTVLLTVCPVSDPISVQLATAVHVAGGTVVTLALPAPERVLHAIAESRATIVHLSTVVAVGLAKLAGNLRALADVDSVDLALLSSPSCPRDVLTTLVNSWGPAVRQLYVVPGVGVVTAIEGTDILARPASVGRDPAGALSIVDEHGNTLAPGCEGLLRVARGEEAMTAQERGYLDSDGYLHLVDRDSFRVSTSGGVVAPRELENLLVAHPAVAGAAVLGVSRRVVAFVEVAGGFRPGPDLERELLDHLREQVPHDWLPRRIDFTERLPRTANGKLDKRRLTPRDGLAVGGL